MYSNPNMFAHANNNYYGASGATAGVMGGSNLGHANHQYKQTMGFNPANVTAPSMNLGPANHTMQQGMGYSAPTLAKTNLSQYQNPYTSEVIDRTVGDMNRTRQMVNNDIGAQATAAGAFGGSRHGLVEAENNRNFADRTANVSAGLRDQGYRTALGAAQFDIGNNMASQGMRNSVADAYYDNQMTRGQMDVSRQFGNVANDITAQGMGDSAAGQYSSNIFANNAQKLNAAAQLGNLSGMGFDRANAINSNIASDGRQQQAINQALIDIAKGNFAGFTGSPQQSLQLPLAAVGGSPGGNTGTQTSSQQPGLFNYLALGLGLL